MNCFVVIKIYFGISQNLVIKYFSLILCFLSNLKFGPLKNVRPQRFLVFVHIFDAKN